jgi:hypothetical protein
MPRERPANKGVGVTVVHCVFGREIFHNCHVLVEPRFVDDLLGFPDWSLATAARLVDI